MLHQTRDDFVSLNTQSESKTKPNGWKTESDFVKRKIVPEIYTYTDKFICRCVKLRMFGEYQYQHIQAILVSAKLLKIHSIEPMLSFKFQTIMSHHIFIYTHKL